MIDIKFIWIKKFIFFLNIRIDENIDSLIIIIIIFYFKWNFIINKYIEWL